MRLEVDDLHVRYGRVHAVRGVSLKVEEGEVVAVLGANGAGKSSLLKALMGLEPAAEGRITLDDTDITRWPTSRRVRQHLALVPEAASSWLLPLRIGHVRAYAMFALGEPMEAPAELRGRPVPDRKRILAENDRRRNPARARPIHGPASHETDVGRSSAISRHR